MYATDRYRWMRKACAPAAMLLLGVVLLAAWTSPALAAAPEEPITEPPTGATATEATVHGVLNPGASASAGFDFSYGTGGSCEGNTTEPQPEQIGKAIEVESLLTGLVPSTEYSFCVVANRTEEEVTESSAGKPLTFKTADAVPTVASESASAITPFAATLEAQVNPENQATTGCRFEYGTLTVSEQTAPCNPETLEGFGEQPITASISELAPTTTYSYRVVIENATGTSEGPGREFTTTGAPIATTSPAQAITRTSAVLSGGVDPGGEATSYHFAYATSADYRPGAPNPYDDGARTTESPPLGAGYSVHTAGPVTATELLPGTSYHYALVATNSVGTTIGPAVSFTTAPPAPPLAFTGEATGVTPISATINGSVDDRELATVSQFEFGTTPGAGTLVPATVSGGSTQTITAVFDSDLTPGTTYYYRTVATGVDGIGYGEVRSFTTATFPARAVPPPLSLVAWPRFALEELAAGIPPVSGAIAPKSVTNKQKLAKALKACAKQHDKRKRTSCRRAAGRRFR